MRARKETIEPYGQLIIGVDRAAGGADRTLIARQRGFSLPKVKSWRDLDEMQVAGLVMRIIQEEKPDRVNIDVGGLGHGIYAVSRTCRSPCFSR